MASTYSWIGGTLGAWADPAVWTPAGGPPGATDRADLNGNFVVTSNDVPGDGVAGAVNSGAGTFAGSFTFESLHVSDMFEQEATLTSGVDRIGAIQSRGTLVVTQATVSTGSVMLGEPPVEGPFLPHPQSGTLILRDHATLTADAVSLYQGTGLTILGMDATSRLEIGSAGTGAVGTLTVDADGSIMGAGVVVAPVLLNRGTVAVSYIEGTVLNDGTLRGGVTAGVNNGVMSGSISNVINNGTITGGSIRGVTSTGTILTGSRLSVIGGNAGTVTFNQPDGTVAAASTRALDGLVLAGFGSGNSILEDGLIATDASWSATGDGIGKVTLTRNGTIVTTATLAGTYDGATFVILPLQPTWQSSTALYLAEGTFGAGNAPPSAGVATADALGWAGGAGDWGDATHWRDLVTGGSVAAAPGIGNTVTIDLQDGANVLSGQGEAASLSLLGQMILCGNVTAGTLTLGNAGRSGRPVVWQGGTLVAGELDVPGGGVWAHGGVVSIAGTASVGTIDVSVPGDTWIQTGTLAAVNGGTLHLGGPVSLAAGLVTLDDASVLEIGSGATATAGTLTVDADGWIGSGSWPVGTIAGSAIRNAGTIALATLEGDVANLGLLQGVTAQTVRNDGTVVDGVIGQVTGTGRIEVADTLELGAAAEQHVAFRDDSATLVLTAPDQAPVLDGFMKGDRIILKSVIATSATYVATSEAMGRLDLLDGDTTVASLTLTGDYTGQAFYMGGSNMVTLEPPAPPPCFVTGTLIRTRRGEVPVEELRVADEVATRLPLGFRPIRWIGRRTLRPGAHPAPAAVRPIRIRAGAFGRALPRRDLLLSPDHALYLADVLIPVRLLVDGDAIAPVDLPQVTYWHVELDRHDVLLAEGLPAESYLDAGDRHAFGEDGVVTLHPRFGWLAHDAEGCAPLVVTGRVVDRLRADLRRRAARRHVRVPGC